MIVKLLQLLVIMIATINSTIILPSFLQKSRLSIIHHITRFYKSDLSTEKSFPLIEILKEMKALEIQSKNLPTTYHRSLHEKLYQNLITKYDDVIYKQATKPIENKEEFKERVKLLSALCKHLRQIAREINDEEKK